MLGFSDTITSVKMIINHRIGIYFKINKTSQKR